MKPAPSDHLLGPGQTWVVVEATRWGLVSVWKCNVRTQDPSGYVDFCRAPSVIFDQETTFSNGDILCEEHMGYHRWIDNGVVMQWKADPPWVYQPRRPRMPARKR